jgi:two-component system, cell cycle sensor histidine kinase and response regulator CckA
MPKKATQAQPQEMLRRYEFIVNTSRDWHTLINRDYVYEAANKAFCDAQGKSRADIIGTAVAELWGKKTFQEIIKATLDRCFAGREVNYQAWFELPVRGLQCYDITCYPYRDNDETVTHAVIVTRDITRRKMADDAKRKLEFELQQARKIESLATLSGGIAHEFNNALMVVAGNIELLQINLPDNQAVDKFAKATNESIRRMSNLTKQLLAYAREGDFRLNKLDLSNFVKSILPVIKDEIDASVHIETRLKIDLPYIKADQNQLQMTVSAIVKNAAEAMEKGGRIIITTDCQVIEETQSAIPPGLDPGPYVCLTVEDNGKGMDETTRSRIFEPFFTTKFQGRGLGMAAVYGIIKNHRGYIYVDSKPGQGTIVRILLPPMGARDTRKKKPSSSDPTGKKTILVIEDEEKVLDTIQSLIERLGYQVLRAGTAKAAIELTKVYKGPIDLALLDIKLPDMEGGAIYPLIQQARPDMKVMVCSGYSLGERVQKILKAGAHGFIQKPFSLETISVKLKEMLED